ATIGVLRPVAAGEDRQEPVVTDATARQPDEPLADVLRQGSRAAGIEPQPDRRGDLVDVLTARPRGPDELERDLVVGDRDAAVDLDHRDNEEDGRGTTNDTNLHE